MTVYTKPPQKKPVPGTGATYGPPPPAVDGPPAPVQPKLSPAAPALKAKPVTPQNAAPMGPPSPTLQSRGFTGGLGDFANRVETVVAAHLQTHGFQPDPDLVLHLAASDVPTQHLPSMLNVPQNTTAAKAQTVVNHSRPLTTTPAYTPHDLITQLRSVAKGNSYDGGAVYHDWMTAHEAQVKLLQDDPHYAAAVNAIVAGRANRDGLEHRAEVDSGQIVPAGGLGVFWKAIDQVAQSLVHSPEGMYRVVAASVHDTITHPSDKKQLPPIAKAMVQQTGQDFRHPLRNPGFLALDVFGAISLGGGTAARLGAAGRVARAGEGAGATISALARKPAPRRFVINHGGYTEETLLSQNPVVAAYQARRLKSRQAAADLRSEGGASTASVLLPDKAADWLDRNLSFERKVGRESDARQRTEFVADMHQVRELDHAVATANTVSGVARLLGKGSSKLTRGQQKALWVLATDDADPLAANVAFHKRMIDQADGWAPQFGMSTKQFVANHNRHLVDLDAAARVLANPSPGFQRVADMVQKVVGDMERMKVDDLGLSPRTAEGRVAKVGQVLRGEDVTGGAQANPDAFYVPTQPKGRVKRPPSQARGRFSLNAGPYGIGKPRDQPELTHEFTGKSLVAGNNRIDATSLVGEAYGRTVRAVSVKAHHDKLWEHGADTYANIPEQYRLAVRDTSTIPDKLRELVAKIDEGDFTQADKDLLPSDMKALLDELYPDKKLAESMPGVRWVDGRLVGSLEGAPSREAAAWTAPFDAINTPLRFITLYARPAYILNKLGNAAMLIFDQGFMRAGQNWARAMQADKLYGPENAAAIRSHVGAGRAQSYVNSRSGHVSKAFADFWARVADRDERVASWIYYADRMGYRSSAEVHALLHDAEKRGDLTEVSRRANKALVEFDNLSDVEKHTLRHLIFVYPWVSRSSVWSLRAVMDHPAKVSVLSHLGREALEDDPYLSKAPSWFRRTGYIPIGMGSDGKPNVVNPTSINTFSTLADLMNVGHAGVVGDPYGSSSDLFGPAAKFFLLASSGRDEFGNKYPGSQWLGAAKDVLRALPQVAMVEKNQKSNPPLKPFDVTDRASMAARYRSALKQTVFTPGWLGGYGGYIAGGFSPRGLNVAAKEARFWKDATPEQRHVWERRMLNDALSLQGDLLARPVPKPVTRAVRLGADLTFQMAKWSKEQGHTPTDAEKNAFARKFYKANGLDDAGVKEMKRSLRKWDADVRLVHSFRPEVMTPKMRALKSQGLVASAALPSQEVQTEYGRRFVDWQDKLRALVKSDATPAEVRAFVDKSDTPEGGLPSFTAMSWANLTPDEQETQLRQAASTSWKNLSSFDKKLLGVTVAPEVSQGWAAYEKAVDEYHSKPDNPPLQQDQKDGLAKQIDRVYPGFGKDYVFAQQPRETQFEQTRVYKALPDKALFDAALGGPAKKLAATIKANGDAAYYMRYWRQYIHEEIQPWLEKHPELKKEMGDMGTDFMAGLPG